MKNSLTPFIALAVLLVLAFSFSNLKDGITGKAVVDTSNIEETSYVYGNGLIARVDKEGLRYYHNDYLGSPTVITDASGNKISEQRYDVFGNSLNPEISRLEFTGKELDDDTNLHYFNARYYDSSIGRFTTADTVKGRLSNPQSLNLYVYTLNNPLKYVDPSGNQEKSELIGGSPEKLIEWYVKSDLETTVRALRKVTLYNIDQSREPSDIYSWQINDLVKSLSIMESGFYSKNPSMGDRIVKMGSFVRILFSNEAARLHHDYASGKYLSEEGTKKYSEKKYQPPEIETLLRKELSFLIQAINYYEVDDQSELAEAIIIDSRDSRFSKEIPIVKRRIEEIQDFLKRKEKERTDREAELNGLWLIH